MTAKAKYLFDLDFAAGADSARKPMTPAEADAKLAEAESQGYRNGFAAAEQEGIATTARRAAVALEQIGNALGEMARDLTAIELKMEADAIELAAAIARKLAPELLAREPFTEIAALATECLKQLAAAPHVIVRVNDSLHDTARDQLEQIARDRGFQGRVVVIAEPDIAIGDCRIEWADGGVIRDQAKTDLAIGTVIGRYLDARHTAAELGDSRQ